MGLNSSKIDRDTAKSVKLQILKNNRFCLKNYFLNENCYFSFIDKIIFEIQIKTVCKSFFKIKFVHRKEFILKIN